MPISGRDILSRNNLTRINISITFVVEVLIEALSGRMN